MPLIKLTFKPGVNREQTDYANTGGWYSCDKIRFRSGQPEKIGGWDKYSTLAYDGVCRSLYNYVTTNSDNLLVAGTNAKVYLYVGPQAIEVTPLRATFTTTATDNCFATTANSRFVVVTITGHGALAGDYVRFSGATAVGGIPAASLNTSLLVTSVAGANTFTVDAVVQATSTVAAGGGTAITAQFNVHSGPANTSYGYGFGTGAWGTGTWGTPSTTALAFQQQDWFFDNLSNDLIGNIRNGGVYYWTYTSAFNTRMVALSSMVGATDAPVKATITMVSQGDRHVLALGCTPYGGLSTDFDPLLVRWSSQDDPLIWNPLATNSAGFLRISNGSRIVAAKRTRQETLIWTEASLNSLQYLGTTDVFNLQELADNISIMSPRAATTAGNIAFWMGVDKFYMYTGQVQTLPCTLRQYVFSDINFAQKDAVVCGTNEAFSEVWWFYPSATSEEVDKYVVYNYLEQIWYYGTLSRTAWLDTPLQQNPIGALNGYLYNHEKGVDADGAPIEAFITSSQFDISNEGGNGTQMMLIRRILPDVTFAGSTVENPVLYVSMKPTYFSGNPPANEPDLPVVGDMTPVQSYTDQVYIRARGRQMAFKILSTAAGVTWQLGTPRLDLRPDGRR